MKQFYLSEITTKDGLIHQGIYYKPQKPGKKALLWIHGLTGRFYGDVKMMEEMAEACEKEGLGFASFNNRGHDHITSTHKIDKTYAFIGGGREIFEDCIHDIDAAVKFLVKRGFSEIILVGLSTGANKACFYAATQENTYVNGIVLASPISDRMIPFVGTRWYERVILQLLVAIGRGDMLISGKRYFPGTPKRFLSLMTVRSNEDIFDYGEPEPTLTRFSTVTKPLFILLAGSDQLTDRSIATIKKAFDAHQNSVLYKSIVIPSANHGFDGKEKEIATAICDWSSSI